MTRDWFTQRDETMGFIREGYILYSKLSVHTSFFTALLHCISFVEWNCMFSVDEHEIANVY